MVGGGREMKTGGLYIDADGVSVPVAPNIRAAPHGVQVKEGAVWVPKKPADTLKT